jgi:hypothetical protein
MEPLMMLCEPVEIEQCQVKLEPVCCPACGSLMAEMRNSRRCLNCSFVICSECDGE